MECTRLASERAQLDFRKKEVADRKRKLETLASTWRPKLSAIVGENWEPETLEPKFQSLLAKQSKSLQDARKKRDQAREKQQKVEYRLKTAKESQDSKSQDATERKQEVLAALRKVRDGAVIEDFSEEVTAVEQQVEDLRNELSLFDALVDYYSKCKRMLETKKRCLLCDRHFDDSQSASLDRLSKKIDKHLDPKGRGEVQTDYKEALASLESLRAVRASYDTYERLSTEVPKLRDEYKAIQAEHDALERQVEELESAVSSEEEKHRDMEELSKTVTNISQTIKDIQESEGQVERIMSQQSAGAVSRSAEEIHEAQAAIAEQMRGLKSRIAKLTSDRQRMKDQINGLELERSELNNKIGRAAGQLEKKKDLLAQIQSLKDDHTAQREIIQRADEDLESLEPSITEARSVRDETLRHGRQKEQVIIDERDAIANSVSEIKMLDSDIADYIDRGGPSNLASNQRAIAALEKSISNTEKDITDVTVRTNKLKQDIANGDRKKKNISDNLNYRKHLRTLEVLRKDIAELEDRNAHEDYERLQAEARSLENHSNRLFAERGSVMGTMKTKDEELGRLLQEWEMDYKDAKQKYRESHIRVETTKAAIEDLAQCGAAVDKAVMQFHSLKMAEVNRIAGELWQSTYQAPTSTPS